MQNLMETWKSYIAEIQNEESNVISFDFDDTLALEDSEYHYIGPNEPLLSLFKQFQGKGFKVYIVTSRLEKNEDMYRKRPNTAVVDTYIKENGINPDRIIFTNMEDKVHTLRRIGALLHFDDDEFELAAIDQIAPEIGTVRINYSDGSIMSGQEHIDRLLGETE